MDDSTILLIFMGSATALVVFSYVCMFRAMFTEVRSFKLKVNYQHIETDKKTGYTSSISCFHGQPAVPQNRLSYIKIVLLQSQKKSFTYLSDLFSSSGKQYERRKSGGSFVTGFI